VTDAVPIATALVSTWSSERYLRGCLDDLLAQTIGDRLEILVIDAGSPEREGEIVREYQRRHANVRYVRSPERESTSVAFNRGTALARGRYLTTANTDDRHHPAFFERMVAVLDAHPEFGIAYADSAITNRDNETWAQNTATKRFAWPDYTPAVALNCCLFGAQPVWRREVHEVVGPWDPALRHANDQDLFLRIARRFGAVHVRETLGLFLQRPDSVAGSGSHDATLREALQVFRDHRTSWALHEIVPGVAHDDSPFAIAAAWFEVGNLAALGPYTDAEFALQCWQRALAVDAAAEPVRTVFTNNCGALLACAGADNAAAKSFAACRDRDLAERNLARIAAARAKGESPKIRDLVFEGLDHEVVRASRRTRGLRCDATGRMAWSPSVEQVPWDVFVGPNGVPLASGATGEPWCGDLQNVVCSPGSDPRRLAPPLCTA